MCPDYMGQLIKVHQPSTKLRSGDAQLLLHVPMARLVTYGFRSFTKAAPELWNALPKTIRLQHCRKVQVTTQDLFIQAM